MAEINRTIKSTLAIAGEKEYTQAITRANAELRNLQSELKLVESQFAGSANTYDAIKAKVDALTAVYDTQVRKVEQYKTNIAAANDNIKQHEAAITELKAAQEKLTTSTAQTTDEQEKAKQKHDELERAIRRHEASIESTQKTELGWRTSLNSAQTELNGIGRELDKTKGYLQEAAISADGTAKSIDNYGKEVKETAEETKEMADKTNEAGQAVDAMARIIVASGAVRLYGEVRDAIRETIDASIDFESALTGVYKTVEGTPEQLAAISDGIKLMALDMPMAAKDIAAIAENAGQLGIETDNILEFTRVMADLGVTTNLSADEAASSLAKFANIIRMSSDDYENLGSVIVALGNNYATTERDIVSMATRLTATGAVVGLNASQIMAVATALSSVGIEAEAGGSAISKLLKQIEVSAKTYGTAKTAIDSTGMALRELTMLADTDASAFKSMANEMELTSQELREFMRSVSTLEQFSQVAGTTSEEFIAAWGDNAVGALDKFITGLNDTEKMGKSAVEVLDEMGITEVRLSNAILSLANSGGILTDTLELANTAWDENTALADEAALRYGTTESKLTMLENAVTNLKITIGDVLNPVIQNSIGLGVGMATVLNKFVTDHPDVVKALLAVASGLGALAIAGTMIPLITTLWGVLAANPVGLVAAAVIALTAAMGAYIITLQQNQTEADLVVAATDKVIDKIEESRESYKAAQGAIADQSDSAMVLVARMESLLKINERSESQNRLLKSTIEELNEVVPGLDLQYNELMGTVNLTSDSIVAMIETMRRQAEFEANIEAFKDAYKQREEITKAHIEVTEALERAKQRLSDADIALDESSLHDIQKYAGEVIKAQDDVERLTLRQSELEEQSKRNRANIRYLEDSINNYSDSTQKAAEKTGEISDAMRDMADESQQALDSMDGKSAGESLVDGLAEGITGNAPEAIRAAEDLAGEIKATFERAMDMHSPSRVFEQYGEWLDEGLIEGVYNKSRDVQTALSDMINTAGDKSAATASAVGKALGNQISTEITAAMYGAYESMRNLGGVITDKSGKEYKVTPQGEVDILKSLYERYGEGMSESEFSAYMDNRVSAWRDGNIAAGWNPNLSSAQMADLHNMGYINKPPSDDVLRELGMISYSPGEGYRNGIPVPDNDTQNWIDKMRGASSNLTKTSSVANTTTNTISQTYNFNQPVQSPYETARAIKDTMEEMLY